MYTRRNIRGQLIIQVQKINRDIFDMFRECKNDKEKAAMKDILLKAIEVNMNGSSERD